MMSFGKYNHSQVEMLNGTVPNEKSNFRPGSIPNPSHPILRFKKFRPIPSHPTFQKSRPIPSHVSKNSVPSHPTFQKFPSHPIPFFFSSHPIPSHVSKISSHPIPLKFRGTVPGWSHLTSLLMDSPPHTWLNPESKQESD